MLYILGCIALGLVSAAVLPSALRGLRDPNVIGLAKNAIGCAFALFVVALIVSIVALGIYVAAEYASAHPNEAELFAIFAGGALVIFAALAAATKAWVERPTIASTIEPQPPTPTPPPPLAPGHGFNPPSPSGGYLDRMRNGLPPTPPE